MMDQTRAIISDSPAIGIIGTARKGKSTLLRISSRG
jgi:ABC-type phosphate/phosphonate transport system ATPase subunit